MMSNFVKNLLRTYLILLKTDFGIKHSLILNLSIVFFLFIFLGCFSILIRLEFKFKFSQLLEKNVSLVWLFMVLYYLYDQ